VNETDVCADGDTGDWTDREVPMHWGHVAGRSPRYLVFHCDAAPPPAAGGETLFTDTTLVLARTTPAERAARASVRICCGSGPGASLIGRHALTGETVLRYAEPMDH
jgi:hypothetical protein